MPRKNFTRCPRCCAHVAARSLTSCPSCAHRARQASAKKLRRGALITAALIALGAAPQDALAEVGDSDSDGILDARDACPTVPEDMDGFEDDDGCPEVDNDMDSVTDVSDMCPNTPEDLDGFQDDDGCPEEDDDGDGIADANDLCPMDPELFNGIEDEDGCPELPPAVAIYGLPAIEISEVVFFDFDADAVNQSARPLLDDIAQVMQDNPQLQLRIQGHACQPEDGDLEAISTRRALNVQTYLTSRGVPTDRLETEGKACEAPLADPATASEQERARNERVDFAVSEKP